MGADSKVFAGKTLPKGVQSWSLLNVDGKRCMAPGGEGVEISEFPIEELDVDLIRKVWGEGTYRVQFIGTRQGQRKPLGSRIINIVPTQTAVRSAPVADAAPSFPESDPLAGAFRVVDAIDRRAAAQAERDRDFLRAVLEAGRDRGDSTLTNEVRELRSLVQAQATQIATLTNTLAGAGTVSDEEDEDEDEEEDEEEDDDGDDGRIFRPGESIKDTAIAEGLNALVSIAKDLSPVVQTLAAAKMQALAEELRQQKVEPHALNGSSTPATAPSEAAG